MITIIVCILRDKHREKQKKKREEEENKILPYLLNSLSPKDIEIDECGESNDTFLTKDDVIQLVLSRMYNRPNRQGSILVFVSSVAGEDHSKMRTIRLLQVCSTLNFQIYYVDDVYGKDRMMYLKQFLATRQLRCDKIIKYEDNIVIKELGQYDVILHPYAGLSSAYEILVGVIKELQTK